jgi:O-antigen ligase
VLLAAAGLRPLFTDLDGVLRLEGSTHPAFLGGFAMTGVYAALVELYRDGKNKHLAMIVVNFLILVASGARAPLACALVVTAAAFFMLKSERFPARRRIPLVLAGALLLPVAVGLASGSSSIRLLNVLSSEAGDLSGRDLIWPRFEAAWDASPIFGWGIGAGKNVVDPDSLLAKLLGTTAAHNEYLRMGVDGGYFGLGLLILTMAVWAIRWTRDARPTDRFIIRMVFVCFAVHSFTDNTLIAATASVLFAWVSAVFARGELEREGAVSRRRRASVAAERGGDAAQIA